MCRENDEEQEDEELLRAIDDCMIDIRNLMRMANDKQRDILMTIIHHSQTSIQEPFKFFFRGPASTGKLFVIKLIMEIYYRFT